MLRYLVRRLLLTIPVLLGVATLVFSLIHLVPGDPAQAMLGDGASPQDVAELRRSLGLDRPLLEQYVAFLARRGHGDLGMSFRTGQPVTAMIVERMPATAELALAAMVVAVVIALPLGIIAAVWRGTAVDHGAMTLRAGRHVDSELLARPAAGDHLCRRAGWLPVSGRGTLAHLVLPAVSLGPGAGGDSGAHDARQPARGAARAVRARRAGARRVARRGRRPRTRLRNSLIPLVTIVALQFGAVLTGAVITETIFAWPGIGRLLIQSIGFRDYPMVQGCILLIAVTYVAVNLVTDLLYGVLDPRIRLE